jgi:hypothetical protein
VLFTHHEALIIGLLILEQLLATLNLHVTKSIIGFLQTHEPSCNHKALHTVKKRCVNSKSTLADVLEQATCQVEGRQEHTEWRLDVLLNTVRFPSKALSWHLGQITYTTPTKKGNNAMQ